MTTTDCSRHLDDNDDIIKLIFLTWLMDYDVVVLVLLASWKDDGNEVVLVLLDLQMADDVVVFDLLALHG